ncbi:MAG: dihydrolipoamide dehydrogenase [Hyphomicrobiales bacterium]|nr:dihydrolipoamide dehydrogenase [Hyphomicrobiales bacterium]
MTDDLTPDLCVIGAGSGGLSVAAAAAAMGVSVVLVEKGKMGGDCLNYGCVPSKSLIAAGHVAQAMREAGRFGIRAVEPQVDLAATMRHVREVIAEIAPNDSQERFTSMGVTVIRAAGRFTGAKSLEAGGKTIRARRFVIATGSSPALPPVPGIEQVRALTNESIFDLDKMPTRLVVLGGGPIGLELAQAFRRLGCDVVVLDIGKMLPREDPEFAELAAAQLAREGVVLREGVRIARVESHGPGIRVHLEGGETVDGSHLLVATGRKANVHGLGLEAAGVRFTPKGIEVGPDLRSSNRRIYAIGDVAGGAQFTHAANYHAGLVIRATLFRLRVRLQPHLVPRVTYTDPEIAVAGLSEAEARQQDGKVRVLRWPFAENDRAQAERRTAGHVKVVLARNGTILGAGIVGPQAGELIALWQMAVTRGLKIGAIAGLVLPYPTLSEVSKRAAVTAFMPTLSNKWLRRLLGALRKFG